jgi:pimeloyl-ACP methyl ester carboxylesterase
LLLVLWPLVPGRACGQAACPPGPPAQGILIIANGAGDSRAATDYLTKAFRENHIPFYLDTLYWSLGDVFRDVTNQANHRAAGQFLAAKVNAYRTAHGGGRVVLLSHSSGAAVVLAAVEILPPGTVDRVIVLAPGCSTLYDLRPALYRVREGIDVFYSTQDEVLANMVNLTGTTDGVHAPAAGRVGFTPIITCPDDLGLYLKLHQYRWYPALRSVHNYGGHIGTLHLAFLRAYILPRIVGYDLGMRGPPLIP